MAQRSVESTHVVTGPRGWLSPLWQASRELTMGAEWERRFELVCALGMGTSGAVFEALDRETGRSLALKILRRCEPQALLRFKQEFRVLSEIAHPNLVAVHELIVDAEQRACYSMDLVRGRSFLEYVRAADGGCDAVRLRAALEQLVRGVQCLHAHGVLHRDLKPANVLIDAAGRLSLVDFGLAQRCADAAAPGQFEGTPAYAAPEQLASAIFSYESDWYGVGVMLYEALTGRRPVHLPLAEGGCPPSPSLLLGPAHALAIPEDLERVCMALLAQDPAQRPNGAQVLAMLGAARACHAETPVPAADGGEQPPLLWGRAVELEQLSAACGATRTGASAVALALRGPSGIGKTSLADALLTRLQADASNVVLRSRCFVHESVHYNAFDGIIDDLAAHLQTLPKAELTALEPQGLLALVQLFPALRASFGPCELGDASQLAREAAFSALRQLLRRLAERAQVVLFIDDLQWADADSAQLLTSLVSSELGTVWLLATWRSDVAPTPQLRAALAHFEQVELGPLPNEAAAALVRAEVAGCDAALADEIAAKAAGHPLHVRELIRQVCEHGPGSALDACALDHALMRRIERLTAPARALLELVCVAGRPLACSLLLGAQEVGEQAALRELRAARLTRDSKLDAGLAYVEVQHDRVRSALLSQLPSARVRALHASLAERLLAGGASTRALEQAVQHQLLAGKRKEAGLLAERAAEGALARLAFHSAADLWLLALAQAERGSHAEQRLQLKAAEASARAGRMWQAARLFERAAMAAGSASERVELQLAAVLAYGVSGHGQRAGQLLNGLKSELELPLGFVLLPVALGRLWLLYVSNLGLPALRTTPTTSKLSFLQPEAALHILWRATPSLLVVDPELSCQFAARALRLAAQQAEPAIYGQALAFHMTAMCMFWGRCSPAQKRTMQRAQRLVAKHGDRWDEAFVHVMLAGEAAHQWQYARAARLSEQAAASRELSTPYAAGVRALARTVLLPSLFNAGELARGGELAEEYIRDAVTCGDRHQEFGCRVVGAHRYLYRDDPQQAQTELAVARAIELDYPHMALSDPQWETGVALYKGDARGALARYDQLRAGAGREVGAAHATRLRFAAVEACCLLACVARHGMTAELLHRLRRSLRLLEHSGCRAAQPVAAQVTATLALRVGASSWGVAQLQAAAGQLDALGMPLYAASLRLGAARAQKRGAAAAEREALGVLTRAGVIAPQRWANMLAPGLGLDAQPQASK